jgi:hypothetical protein
MVCLKFCKLSSRSMHVLSHNHAQQKAMKLLYKIYILDFCFMFQGIFMQLNFIK